MKGWINSKKAEQFKGLTGTHTFFYIKSQIKLSLWLKLQTNQTLSGSRT